ncbi:MAG: polysaccharide biosynthesis protein [Gemmatimonadetes bacterium]|nr:polysaccharide biosynthesis protein [Gemmatimonadota bacterium]
MRDTLRNGFRNRYLFALDLVLLPLATYLAFVVRFEGLFDWREPYRAVAPVFLAVTLPVKLALLISFGLYRRLWRFASVSELESILLATGTSAVLCSVIGLWVLPWLGLIPLRVPLGVLAVDALMTAVAVSLPRFILRTVMWHLEGRPGHGGARVLIAGAGQAGGFLVKQLKSHGEIGLIPIGFVDDDQGKQDHKLHGLPVLGRLADTARVCREHAIGEILIAMPTAPGTVVRDLVRAASDAGVRTRTLPGLSDILSGRFDPFALRQVEIHDLLRREPVNIDLRQVQGLITERVVLVTGAGGSIGSELCRQVCALEPARLVLLGHGENSIFGIQQELRERFPHIPLESIIADVKDGARLGAIFERFGPYTVFHAAAHKHVPLMEENVAEAVLNNVLGTRNVVTAAAQAGTAHLVLISTDKAVRPTSVMGATKRVAEQIVQTFAEDRGRNFAAVRFGNVLGSRGSVVLTFLKQIAAGGPVTVTHPEMRRYFMTIPEAVQLVLQAGALGKGGEVFVLDMGEPVKIADLAADLIRLSGKEVGRDVEIRFSGTRPGEKLYEELFFDAEHASPTEHPKVLRARNAALPVGVSTVVGDLIQAAEEGWAAEDLRGLLKRLVPDYEPSLAGMPVRQENRSRDSGKRLRGEE